MANEPGAAILEIFARLIDTIKQRYPKDSEGRPINSRVYSQLVLGMPIYKADYFNPWTPQGSSFAEAPTEEELNQNAELNRQMQAAWKTSLLCNMMLKVTKDDSYLEYPLGRHLDFAYGTIVNSMTPLDLPEETDEIKQRRINAQKVLYNVEPDGTVAIWDKKPIYENYLKNAEAVADAEAAYAEGSLAAQTDPAKHAAWPVTSSRLKQKVDAARDNLKSEGAEQVERALATIGSIGIPAQGYLIDKAKDTFDTWQLGLTGVVPDDSPYSLVMPTNWCDPNDHEGWQKLTVNRSSYQSYSSETATDSSASSWLSRAKSTGGSAGVTVLGIAAFGGSAARSEAQTNWQSTTENNFRSNFSNDSTNLSIELEYGMCTMIRPWLVSDLFYVGNWYLSGETEKSISDGTVDGQVNSQDKLLPMIPQQFLVIRNVKISSSSWGSDGEKLSSFYGTETSHTEELSTEWAGTGGIALGFVNFGGSGKRRSSESTSESNSWNARNSSDYFGTTFDGETLEIPGAQIVAFLSDITPASPPKPDPALAQT